MRAVSKLGGFFYFFQMPRPLPVIVNDQNETRQKDKEARDSQRKP